MRVAVPGDWLETLWPYRVNSFYLWSKYPTDVYLVLSIDLSINNQDSVSQFRLLIKKNNSLTPANPNEATVTFLPEINLAGKTFIDVFQIQDIKNAAEPKTIFYTLGQGVVGFEFSANQLWVVENRWFLQ